MPEGARAGRRPRVQLVPLPSGSVSLLSFAGRGRAATEDRARAAVTQTAEFGYPPILPPCTPPQPETNFRSLQSASEAPITERRFSLSSIPLGQSVACQGNLRKGNGHPLRRRPPRTAPASTCRTNGRGKEPEHCTSSEVQVRGCSDTTGGRKQRESFP